MMRYSSIVIGVLLIVGLTILQAGISDRFAESNVSAEEQAKLLELVPKSFGDWNGEDKKVDQNVKEMAGSVGAAVSRNYRNSRTGERVDLWLIVGHAKDISNHTPDICYPGSGFITRGKENGLYPLEVDGKTASFWTNTFYKEDSGGRQLIRVFWTWFKPEAKETQGKVVWEAPEHARWRFGNTRALYKMYFTSEMRDSMETPDQSASIHFARDFLPVVEKALTQFAAPEGATATAPSADTAEVPKADAATDEKTSSEAKSEAMPPAPDAPEAVTTAGPEPEGKVDSAPAK